LEDIQRVERHEMFGLETMREVGRWLVVAGRNTDRMVELLPAAEKEVCKKHWAVGLEH
jgi:hypothetical protein